VIPPSLVARAISRGAGEVRVVGCPPDDCSRREGNLWTDERLSRARLPRLKKELENAPIYTFWLPPDAFARALPVLSETKAETHKPGVSYSPILNWRNFALTFGLLAILMTAQVWVTKIWTPAIYPPSQAHVQLVIPDPSILSYPAERFAEKFTQQPTRLVLRDGEAVLLDRPYPFSSKEWMHPLVVNLPAETGDHNLTLSLTSDSDNANSLTFYNRTVTLAPGQVWIIMYDAPPRPK
jgi:hypothetical protein